MHMILFFGLFSNFCFFVCVKLYGKRLSITVKGINNSWHTRTAWTSYSRLNMWNCSLGGFSHVTQHTGNCIVEFDDVLTTCFSCDCWFVTCFNFTGEKITLMSSSVTHTTQGELLLCIFVYLTSVCPTSWWDLAGNEIKVLCCFRNEWDCKRWREGGLNLDFRELEETLTFSKKDKTLNTQS